MDEQKMNGDILKELEEIEKIETEQTAYADAAF